MRDVLFCESETARMSSSLLGKFLEQALLLRAAHSQLQPSLSRPSREQGAKGEIEQPRMSSAPWPTTSASASATIAWTAVLLLPICVPRVASHRQPTPTIRAARAFYYWNCSTVSHGWQQLEAPLRQLCYLNLPRCAWCWPWLQKSNLLALPC